MVLLGVLSALLIAGLLTGGTWAWWLAGRRLPRPRRPSGRGRDAQAALRRHPAGRERWVDPDGLHALTQPDVPGPGQPTWFHIRLADTRSGAVVSAATIPLDSATATQRARAVAAVRALAP